MTIDRKMVGSSRGDGLGEELTATRAGAPRVMRPV